MDVITGAGGMGFRVTFRFDAAPFPQELDPYTLIVPLEADEEKSTMIVLVFPGGVIVAPAGTVHVYDVAFAIGDTE